MLRHSVLLCAALLSFSSSQARASTVHPAGLKTMLQTAGVAFAGTVSRITGGNDPTNRTIASLGSEADAFMPTVRMHWGVFPVEAEAFGEKKCVRDWMHRPLVHVEADRVIVIDASMDSTGQSGSRDPFVVLGRKEDPKVRVSEREFIGFLRSLANPK